MTADARLIGRRCQSTHAPELFAGIIRAVYLTHDDRKHLGRMRVAFLVEREEEQDGYRVGSFWSTPADEVLMARDAPELSLHERGIKVHVPTTTPEPLLPASQRGIVSRLVAWLGGE